MGAAGPVIMFVLTFAATVIVGTFVLAFVARTVLVVVQETGVGQDEVSWPNEPYVDWLGHAVLFIELLGIWVAPAALAARMLRHTWLPEEGFLRVLLLAGPGLWLFFPIGLLSSLSAESRWVPFRWAILVRFVRVAPAALIFYFLTGLMLGGTAALWYYALFGGKGVLLPVAAAVSGAVILIYARLLGRLAWLIQRLPSTQRAVPVPKAAQHTPVRKASRKPSKSGGKKKRKRGPDVQDPWAAPEEERGRSKAKRFPWNEEPPPPKPKKAYQPPSPEEIEGYGIAPEKPVPPDKPPDKPARHPMYTPPEEYEPIGVQSSEPAMPPPENEDSGLFAEQVRQRLAERTRTQPPPPPHPFFSGVYSFPWYSQTFPNWIALTLGLLVVGGLLYALLSLGSGILGSGT
jgi:hypothetical protein